MHVAFCKKLIRRCILHVMTRPSLFFSFPLQSTRSSGTTCRASPSTAMHSFLSPTKLTHTYTKQSWLCSSHARTTACRKQQEEMQGEQMSNVLSRWPGSNACLVFHIYIYYRLYAEIIQGINYMTDFFFLRHVNWVCSSRTCHPPCPHNKECF